MLIFVLLSFVLFNGDGMGESLTNLAGMFGLLGVPWINAFTWYYLKSYSFVLGIAVLASTPLAASSVRRLTEKEKVKKILNIVEPAVLVSMLLLVTGYLVDGSFNPFLYFRF
jgi:alginate O-acetyltransferase complex protein AlgI